VAEQARAQLHVDAAGGVAEDVGAQHAQQALEAHDGHQPDHDHVQRAGRAVHEHLVHHHLEEQRRGQPDHLQHEAGQQRFAQQPAVAHQAGQEPGEVEARELAGQAWRGSSRG
jgi:hypothetical protein